MDCVWKAYGKCMVLDIWANWENTFEGTVQCGREELLRGRKLAT